MQGRWADMCRRGGSSRAMAWGRVAVCVAAVGAVLALASGCGESSGSSASGGSSTPGTTTAAGAHAAGATKTAGGSGAAPKGAGASGGLKYDTAPKYAAPSQSAPVQSGVVQIAYRNIAIDPDTVRVKVGSTVRWTNYDPVVHNVTSQGGPLKFASKNFGEGGTFEVKMTTPGIVHYECTLQPATMNGTIEVVG